jgi:Uma2 family endonuclease
MTDRTMDGPANDHDRWLMESIAFNGDWARRKPISLADYDAQPIDEGPWLEELVRGHVVREPPPAPYHGTVQANLTRLLGNHARATGSGFVFTHGAVRTVSDPEPSVRGPDVAYVSRERASEADLMEQRLRIGPDLAVEVVSRSNSAADLQEKVAEYLSVGSSQVWLVFPNTQQVVVYHRSGEVRMHGAGDSIEGGSAIPGFTAHISDFFQL